jgi:hypothetical protein
MNPFTHLSAGNPGVFEPVAPDASALPWMLLALGVALIATAFLILVRHDFVHTEKLSLALATAGVIAFGFSPILTVQSVIDYGNEVESVTATYESAVADWLHTDYQIDVEATVVTRLLAGDSFVTAYDGQTTTFSVIETTDGDLAVVGDDRAPLASLN